ncbi:MAG: UbiX family flavin prenyltransferase [Arcobacteraceae bacterium]
MKLIVAITGASGVNLSLKFLEKLPSSIDTYVVFSKSAKLALKLENNQNIKEIKSSSNLTFYKENQIDASIASGSFGADAMIILPCSMNTLAKCAVGISDNLITRAFSVMLKEKKNIILSPREMPYSTIALENMLKLSNLNVTIAPPVLGYYSQQQTLEDMENFIVGKLFDLLKIENNLYTRWK